MQLLTVRVRERRGVEEVDIDTLTPKARALAEAIHASTGHQPLGVLIDTGRTLGDSPRHAYVHGTGPEADEIGRRPDLRFQTNLELVPRRSDTPVDEWLEYNARHAMPYDAWPIAGAVSRVEALKTRVPSADAAREDRCLTRDQARSLLAEHGIAIGPDFWIVLQKSGNLPPPRHHALGGRMPLWHVDDLHAYATREVELWPTSRVAEHLGYSGPSATGTARRQLSRWGLNPVGRGAGRGGESRYRSDQVQAAHAARPGRGDRKSVV